MSDLTQGYIFSPAEQNVDSVKLNKIAGAATIKPGAVTTPKMADGAVTEAKLAAGAVSTAKMADGAATLAKLSEQAKRQDHFYAAATSTDNAYSVTLAPAPTSLGAGMLVRFKADAANTDAATLDVNELGAKALRKNGDKALAPGDIAAGEIVEAVYDGTRFQVGKFFRISADTATAPANPGTDVVPYRDSATGTDRCATVNQLRNQLGSASITRQTVVSGKTDSIGRADFIAAGTGLAATLEATATSVVIAFADGFDTGGQKDYLAAIEADEADAWSALPVSTTSYLYVDLDSELVVSYGHTTLQPIYQYTAPAAPSTGQHWFDRSAMKMKRWDGSTWETKRRVFVGQVETDGSGVTAAISYAFQARYESVPLAWANNSEISTEHQLGRRPSEISFSLRCLNPINGYQTGDEVPLANAYLGENQRLTLCATDTEAVLLCRGILLIRRDAVGSVINPLPADWDLICRASDPL